MSRECQIFKIFFPNYVSKKFELSRCDGEVSHFVCARLEVKNVAILVLIQVYVVIVFSLL